MSSAGLKISGARIDNKIITVIPDDQNIRLLRDRMLVEPLDWVPSTVINVIYTGHPLRGIVKAIGPGCYPKLYDHPNKAKRTKVWESKIFRPTEVKVGEIVELGGLEIRGYLFTSDFGFIRWRGKDHIICREQDVVGITQSEAA